MHQPNYISKRGYELFAFNNSTYVIANCARSSTVTVLNTTKEIRWQSRWVDKIIQDGWRESGESSDASSAKLCCRKYLIIRKKSAWDLAMLLWSSISLIPPLPGKSTAINVTTWISNYTMLLSGCNYPSMCEFPRWFDYTAVEVMECESNYTP